MDKATIIVSSIFSMVVIIALVAIISAYARKKFPAKHKRVKDFAIITAFIAWFPLASMIYAVMIGGTAI